MVKILDEKLEREVMRIIGVDRGGILKMYHDAKKGRNYFERINFVMEEYFESELADKVWFGFKLFDDERILVAESIGLALDKFIGELHENS